MSASKKLYRITSVGSTHRGLGKNEKGEMSQVVYGHRSRGLRDEIELTEKGYEQLKGSLGLVEKGKEQPVEIKTGNQQEDDGLDKMKVPELKQLAEDEKIELTAEQNTKGEIISAIRLARSERNPQQ